MTKARTPASTHPWRRYKAITDKPPADKLMSAYVATGKAYKPVKKCGTKIVLN